MSTTPTDPTATRRANDQGDAPASDANGASAARRRHRRASPRVARPEPTPEAPATTREAPEAPAAPAAHSTPPTGAPRRNTRRTGRAPKLVAPAAPADAAPAADSPAAVPAPEPAGVALEAATPSAMERDANSEPAAEPAPPRRHRFRFERPAAATQFAPRAERLSGATIAPTDATGAAAQAPANSAAPVAEGREEAERDGTTTALAAAADSSAPRDDHTQPSAEVTELASAATEPAPTTEEPAEGTHNGAAEEGEESTAARRRRRRRRSGSGSAIRHLEAVAPLGDDVEPEAGDDASDGYAGEVTVIPDYGDRGQPAPPQGPAQQDVWSVGAAHQQLAHPRSPFGAPEPNTPRGFGAQPQGTATPYQERPARTPRTDRAGGDVSSAALAQLGTTLTQAIQQQTDRLLVTMRHTQAPPTMTLALPALPSTERIGVFVDVANLLYSSRSLRIGIDFGRLLEFLRGNRHVVRAHAYAPTNPEPNAEQQFLSVVKGVGYRITTKNFKVFSSGAKKADLDLDLCMDIVRLVDAKAVETIVLVSGDSDFLPLLEYCSDHGVRVEVAAFEDAAAMVLRQSCDLFINLSLVDEIRG
ncbi:MAG TPA: NYN domain-containing protein [Ktedonobacterales bacterium]